MITDEMLREAARESLEDYVNSLERDYDPNHPHQFSKEFEKKIERLKRRANHPVFYKTMQRVASVVLDSGAYYLAVSSSSDEGKSFKLESRTKLRMAPNSITFNRTNGISVFNTDRTLDFYEM